MGNKEGEEKGKKVVGKFSFRIVCTYYKIYVSFVALIVTSRGKPWHKIDVNL